MKRMVIDYRARHELPNQFKNQDCGSRREKTSDFGFWASDFKLLYCVFFCLFLFHPAIFARFVVHPLRPAREFRVFGLINFN
jgi:hypothetical protein